MAATIFSPTVRLVCGDALEMLCREPSESVHCIVTSPPYYGLRDYGVDGQIGMEPSLNEYVDRLVSILREARRVLRKDGTMWLNLGDVYAGSSMTGGSERSTLNGSHQEKRKGKSILFDFNRNIGLPRKSLVGLPWRVAFALQDDGWILRCDIVWAKPGVMPESVADRPTRSHEYIFLFSRSSHYYYDSDSIKEPISNSMRYAIARGAGGDADREYKHDRHSRFGQRSGTRVFSDPDSLRRIAEGRNARSVWIIASQPYHGAHFAPFPKEMVKRCILAGSPQGGTVLDPFVGSGTTCAVAAHYSRHSIGFDINPEYIKMAKRRVFPEIQPRLALEAQCE